MVAGVFPRLTLTKEMPPPLSYTFLLSAMPLLMKIAFDPISAVPPML